MAKEEINMNAPAEQQEQQEFVKAEPIINKRMLMDCAKALGAQLAGSLYRNGWFYVPEKNSAYEKGKLTFMLATEPSVTVEQVLGTWREPFNWLLREVKKDNTLVSKYLETYARLFKERQPGRINWTLQFSERCMETLETKVAIPTGIEIVDPNQAVPDEGDGSIC